MPASSGVVAQECNSPQIALLANKTMQARRFESGGIDEALSLPKIKDGRDFSRKELQRRAVNGTSITTALLAGNEQRQQRPVIVKQHGVRTQPAATAAYRTDDVTLVAVKKAQVHSGHPQRRSSFDAATFAADRAKTSLNGYKSTTQRRYTTGASTTNTHGERTRKVEPPTRNDSSMSTATSQTSQTLSLRLSLAEHVKRENAKYNEKQIKRMLFERWIRTNSKLSYHVIATGDDLEATKSRMSSRGNNS